MTTVAIVAAIALLGGVGEPIARADTPDPMTPKVNAAVNFFNTHSNNARRTLDNYFQTVDFKTGPACTSPAGPNAMSSLGTMATLDTRDALADLRAAAKKKPANKPFDAASGELADAYQDLAKVILETRTYYEGEHRKDACKHGAELHPKVKAAAERFWVANSAMSDVLQQLERVRSEKALKAIEKSSGKKFRWYRQKTMIDARAMLDAFKGQSTTPADASKTEAAKTALATFASTVEAMAALEKKSHAKADQYGYSSFVSATKTFLETARRYEDAIGAGAGSAPGSSGGGRGNGKPDYEKVIGQYNGVVDAHNEVVFGADFK